MKQNKPKVYYAGTPVNTGVKITRVESTTKSSQTKKGGCGCGKK